MEKNSDIELINRLSRKKLSEDEVYIFPVTLCDNEVDVKQIGGILHVSVGADGTITMKGPSHVMFDGVYKPFEK